MAPLRGDVAGILILATLLLAGAPASAQSRWIVRGHGAYWAAIDDQTTVTRISEGIEEQAIHSISDGSSFGLSVEVVVKHRIGLELGILVGGVDTDFTLDTAGAPVSDSDTFDLYATTLGVNYHFTPGEQERTGLYLGAFVQQTNYSDVTFLTGSGRQRTLSFDDDYGVGVKLGLDLPFKSEGSWMFTADLRYVATILESENEGEDLDLYPLIVSIGVGYRF